MNLVEFAPEPDSLSKLTDRLVAEKEIGQFNYNYLLEQEHYFESSRFAGQSLRLGASGAGRGKLC